MKIPLKDNQQILQPVNINTPQGFVTPPQGALGEGMAKLSLNAAQYTDRARKEFAQWQIRQAEIAEDGILNELRQDYLNQLNTALTSADIDEKTNKPKGLLARQGANAAGITVEYDGIYGELKNQIMGKSGQLSPRAQRRLADYMDKDNYAKRLEVAGYEAKQKLAFEENSFKTNLAARLKQAPLMGNKDVLRVNIEDAYEDIDRYFALHGMPKEAAEQAKKEFAGQMTAVNISDALDNNNLKKAKTLFNAFEKDIDANTAAKLKKALKAKQHEENIQGLWKMAQNYTDPVSGEVPLSLLADLVDKQDNLSFFEKQEYLRKLEALNADGKRAAAQAAAEKEERFYGGLNEIIKNGGGESEALKLVDDFASGNKDKFLKEKFIKQMFKSGPQEENVRKFVELRDGIEDGTVTRAMIDSAYDNGLINGASYKSLTHELYTKQAAAVKEKGLSDIEKKQISALMEQKFEGGKFDKDKKEQFKYAFYKTVQERGLGNDFKAQALLIDELVLPALKNNVYTNIFKTDEDKRDFVLEGGLALQNKGLNKADAEKFIDLYMAGAGDNKIPSLKALNKFLKQYPDMFNEGTLDYDAFVTLLAAGAEVNERNMDSAMLQLWEKESGKAFNTVYYPFEGKVKGALDLPEEETVDQRWIRRYNPSAATVPFITGFSRSGVYESSGGFEKVKKIFKERQEQIKKVLEEEKRRKELENRPHKGLDRVRMRL